MQSPIDTGWRGLMLGAFQWVRSRIAAMVGLAALDLLGGGLAVGDRVEPLHLDRDLAVGDRLHLELMQAAEIGDLLEGEGGVLDEPHGGGFRHQGSSHGCRPRDRPPRPGATGRTATSETVIYG